MPRMSDTTTTFADCLRELGVAGQVAEFDTDAAHADGRNAFTYGLL
jgi:hypothetical protein